MDALVARLAEIDASIRETLITTLHPGGEYGSWFEQTWDKLTPVQQETLVRATMSRRPMMMISSTERRLNTEHLLDGRVVTGLGRELVGWAQEHRLLPAKFVRARVAPEGYQYVAPTDAEISEYLVAHNGRWPTKNRVLCERCGTRMWGAGGAVGSHRRACQGQV